MSQTPQPITSPLAIEAAHSSFTGIDFVPRSFARGPVQEGAALYSLELPWASQPQVTILALNRLNRRDGIALVTQIASDKALPDEVVAQIVNRPSVVNEPRGRNSSATVSGGSERKLWLRIGAGGV